ncbi:hypothetical protein BDN72DRAFT_939822 [Pluteus cervinus]|uniref:Uncharacterized protein n=1 Tax=Pluteus cervinus TaxID=181527 RepID=A0ACD3A3S9_9AGAR|nr:hypothetical protein BDN72DRAFT_939822 [Pluteus cervinus]
MSQPSFLISHYARGRDHDEPPVPNPVGTEDFYPFDKEAALRLALFIFKRTQMSAGSADELMNIMKSYYEDEPPPFKGARELYDTIDAIPVGGVPWQEATAKYDGPLPPDAPSWMTETYRFYFRDPLHVMEEQLGNPEFAKHIDYAPKKMYIKRKRGTKRRFRDLMSGTWAWDQATEIAKNPKNHGAMFAPVVLGSDKTTVSVATGQNDYHPLYASLGNLQNHVRRSHRNSVSVVGFLAMPKADHEHRDTPAFRKFRRRLMHVCLLKIMDSLRPWMEEAKVTLCGDGHYRRVIYGIGPYIADYPEQCVLASVVSGWCPRCSARRDQLDDDDAFVHQSHRHTSALSTYVRGSLTELWQGWGIVADVEPFTASFPRANIHELISPDILHQLIKGVFKDHLVDWVVEWIEAQDNGAKIRDELDRRLRVVPDFTGLRRFPDGRDFKQWTGDDSKALMKIFLPAIDGLVPPGMVRAVHAFTEFCYLVRRSVIEEDDLDQLDTLLETFHREREVFRELGIRDHFNLPRQHSMCHYRLLIQRFGAPNGLCSSITESKHIEAVKNPYRRTNRNEPIGQILLINQRMDKLAAFVAYLTEHNMLSSPQPFLEPDPVLTEVAKDEDEDFPDTLEAEDIPLSDLTVVTLPQRPAPTGYSVHLEQLRMEIGVPDLPDHIRQFLFEELEIDPQESPWDVPIDRCPVLEYPLRISIYHSARATFFAPSEPSNPRGLNYDFIRAVPAWRKTAERHDCVFVYNSSDITRRGLSALHVAQVYTFLSFQHDGEPYRCALLRWFVPVEEEPSSDTGMWVVQPAKTTTGRDLYSVEHIGSIVRAAHLMPVYGNDFIPNSLKHYQALTSFEAYYVNKFIDYPAHEIAF